MENKNFNVFGEDLQANIDATVLRIYRQIKEDPKRLKRALDAMCNNNDDDTPWPGDCCDTQSAEKRECKERIEKIPLQNKIYKKFENVDNELKHEKKHECTAEHFVDEIFETLDKIGDKIKIEVYWE